MRPPIAKQQTAALEIKYRDVIQCSSPGGSLPARIFQITDLSVSIYELNLKLRLKVKAFPPKIIHGFTIAAPNDSNEAPLYANGRIEIAHLRFRGRVRDVRIEFFFP